MGELVYLRPKENELNRLLTQVGVAPVADIYITVSKQIWEYICLKKADLEKENKRLELDNIILSEKVDEIMEMGFWERLFRWPYKG